VAFLVLPGYVPVNNPRLLAAITIVFWSFTAFLTRSISMRAQVALLVISFSFSFATLLIYFAFLRPQPPASGRFAQLKLSYLLIGPLGYFVYAVALFQSYHAFDSASQTTILNYTWPLFTVLFTEALFRHGARRTALQGVIESLGILIGFLAVLVLATEGHLTMLEFSNAPGIVWGLLAGVCYGLFSAYSSTVSREEQSTFLLTSVGASVVLVALTATFTGEIGLLGTLTSHDIVFPAVWGCVGNGVGYIFWTRANRLAREQGIGVSAIASAMFILPLSALVIVALLLGENQLLRPHVAASLGLILLGSALCQKAGAVAGWLSRRSAPATEVIK
jgi:drug/metabolite transporter (DMT)-like permease